MRIALTAICLAFGSALALAQANAPANEAPAKPGDSPQSDGRTVSPETKGVQQPQGPTGPTETKSGGAPPESPQGQTPPGMQAAPGGSSKTVVDPEAVKKEPVAQSPVPSQPSATPQPSADGIFQNGVLTVTGADPDNQTAPARFSKRTDAADQLPIAAYALKHLTPDQREPHLPEPAQVDGYLGQHTCYRAGGRRRNLCRHCLSRLAASTPRPCSQFTRADRTGIRARRRQGPDL